MMAQLGLRNTFWALVLPFMFGSPVRDLPAARALSPDPRRPDQRRPPRRRQHAGRDRACGDSVQPAGAGALTLITVVSQWNNFMWPLVITSGTKWRVLTVATADLQSRFNAQWTLVMAATTRRDRAADSCCSWFPSGTSCARSSSRGSSEPSRAFSTPGRHWRWCWSPRCWPLTAVLLDVAARPHGGKIVVTVRLWDDADRRGVSAVVRRRSPARIPISRCASTWSPTRPTSTRCAPTSPAAAPTTSSGCPTPTSPATPTVAG